MASSSHNRVRQTWRAFENWLAAQRTTILQPQLSQSDASSAKDYKKLSSSERSKTTLKQYKTQRREEIEKQFYAAAREEWQKRLRQAGLKDEDWGEMTDAETKAVENALGAHLDHDSASNTLTSTATPPKDDDREPELLALVPAAVAPPRMYAPSLSTSSLASSISSYELVNPSELGSDDDAEEDGSRFFNSLVASHDLTSEEEDMSILNPSWKTFDTPGGGSSTSASAVARQSYGHSHSYSSSNPNWSTDSSRHNSANGSPIQLGTYKSFPFDHVPPAQSTTRSSYSASQVSLQKPKISSASASLWTPPSVSATIPAGVSASSAAAAASSASALVKTKSTSPPTATSHSASASTSSSSSSSTSTSISASTSASSYIGPILLDDPSKPEDKEELFFSGFPSASSEMKEDSFFPSSFKDDVLNPTDEEVEAEIAFEKFKLETRITKIIEFHKTAAEMEVKLGLKICRMRWESGDRAAAKSGRGGKDHGKDEERKLVQEHEKAMKELQIKKEEERKMIVKEERKRRRLLLQQRQANGASAKSLTNGKAKANGKAKKMDSKWLDDYEGVEATFDVETPSLDGVFGKGTTPGPGQKSRAPPSPQIARPKPTHAWNQIPFIQEQEEEDGEDDDHGEYEHEYGRGGYNEYEYESDHRQHDYAQQHQGNYHPHQTFQPSRHDYQREHDSHQTFPPGFGDDMPEEIRRAMSGYSLDGYGSDTMGGYGSSSENRGYSSDAMGYGSDTMGGYGSSAEHAGRGYGSSTETASMRYTTSDGYTSDAMGFTGGMAQPSLSSMSMNTGMPGGMGGIGSSPVEMSTPRVGSHGHSWGAGHPSMAMMSKTPTKSSPLVGRNPFGGQQQQQQQQQPPSISAWGRKNSQPTVTSSPPASAAPPSGSATANTNTNGAGLTASTPLAAVTAGVGSWAKKFSLFGGGSASTPSASENSSEQGRGFFDEDDDEDGTPQKPARRTGGGGGGFFDEEDKWGEEEEDPLAEEPEEDEDEEEEEEEVVAPPPPPPPVTKAGRKGKNAVPAPPPPAPAPVQTTAKGKKGAKGAAAAAKAAPPPPPPAKVVEKPAPAPAPAPAPPAKEIGKKGKKGKQAAKKAGGKAAAAPEPEPEVKSAPSPVPPQPTGKGKKGANSRVVEEPKEEVRYDEEEDEEEDNSLFRSATSTKTASNSLWGSTSDVSSTPKPPAAKVSSIPGAWGAKAPASAVPSKVSGKGLTAGSVMDDSPLPSSVTESLWAKARSTPVANGGGSKTPLPPAGQPKAGWKTNGPSRLGASVFDSFDGQEEEEKAVRKVSPPASALKKTSPPSANGGGASKFGSGSSVTRKGPAKKVTIEEVSDEEDGVLDNSLPLNHRSIMEPRSPDPNARSPLVPSRTPNFSAQASIRQPKPSQPPTVFSNLFDYKNGGEGGHGHGHGGGADGFFGGSGATSPDGMPGYMTDEWLNEAKKQLNGGGMGMGGGARGSAFARSGVGGGGGPGGGGGGVLDQGFATDWEGTVKAKRGSRWGAASAVPTSAASGSGAAAGGFGAMAGAGAGRGYKMPGAMTDDEGVMGGMGGGIPGSFNPRLGPNGGGAMSMWEAKQQQQQQQQQQGLGRGGLGGGGAPASGAKSGWGASATSLSQASSSGMMGAGNGGSGGGGPEPPDDILARFAKSQQLEAMKRSKVSNVNGGGKLF